MRLPVLGCLTAATLSCGLASNLQAQGRFDPEMIFNFVDSNRDGRVDADEIDNSRGPLRDRLRESGVDYSQGLDRDRFIELMNDAQGGDGEGGGDSEGGGGFGGGGEGFGGGFGGGGGGFGGRGGGEGFGGGGEGFGGRGGGFGGRGGGFGGREVGDDDDDQEDDEGGRGGRGRRSRERDEESRDGGGASGQRPAEKIIVREALQTEYVPGDTDKDGQVAFYEWRAWKGRGQSAQFFQLDLNRDGFLTASEIRRGKEMPAIDQSLAGQSSPATGSRATDGDAASNGRSPMGSASRPAVAASPVDNTPIDESNPSVRRYRSYFKLLDRDGNGTVDLQEWERGENTRKKFTSAGIEIVAMDADTFIRQFMKVDAAAGAQ
jgi:Ca2+-binding EF-hand superfamily protein